MGGEKGAELSIVYGSPGSPPHGRGKVKVGRYEYTREGITPAWAGKRKRINKRKDVN